MLPERVAWGLAGLFCGGAIGFLVVGLLMIMNDRIRIVGRWKGVKFGTELIDTSDGRRWIAFGSTDRHPDFQPTYYEGYEVDQAVRVHEVHEEFVRVLP